LSKILGLSNVTAERKKEYLNKFFILTQNKEQTERKRNVKQRDRES